MPGTFSAFFFCILIHYAIGQKTNTDQFAAGLASALLNVIFPQLNNKNEFNIRPQPNFANVPVLTQSRTDLSSNIFDFQRNQPLDLQNFPIGPSPFLGANVGNGLVQNQNPFGSLQSSFFQQPQQQTPVGLSSLIRSAANQPQAFPGSSGNLIDDFSRIGILPTLINLAKPALNREVLNSPPQSLSARQSLLLSSPNPFGSGGIVPEPVFNQAPIWPSNSSDIQLRSAAILTQPIAPQNAIVQSQWPVPNGLVGSGLQPQIGETVNKPKLITANEVEENFGSNCPQCIPIDLVRLAGPWVQVYGNPQALRTIYTSIAHLQSLYGDDSVQTMDFSVIQPSCVGVQFSKPQTQGRRSESTLNLFFRDDSNSRQLHEAVGKVKQDLDASPNSVNIKLPAFDLPMCLVKSGPDTSTMYGYVVLTETIGTNRCRSYHVFTRQADAFFRDHNTEVAAFLKNQVELNSVKPVSVLPFPELCQLQTITKIS